MDTIIYVVRIFINNVLQDTLVYEDYTDAVEFCCLEAGVGEQEGKHHGRTDKLLKFFVNSVSTGVRCTVVGVQVQAKSVKAKKKNEADNTVKLRKLRIRRI